MNRLSLVVAMALLASGSAAAVIVEQAKPSPTYETALARSWEDMQQDPHDGQRHGVSRQQARRKPHPDARSVMEELRHVTIGLEMTTAEAKGEKFDFDAREGGCQQAKNWASVVAEMEAAIAASYPSSSRSRGRSSWMARTPGRTLRQTGDCVPAPMAWSRPSAGRNRSAAQWRANRNDRGATRGDCPCARFTDSSGETWRVPSERVGQHVLRPGDAAWRALALDVLR